jgi:hypothetical protein
MNLSYLIRKCQPSAHSWLEGLLRSEFNNQIDFRPNSCYAPPSGFEKIVFLDDEQDWNVESDAYQALPGRLIITQNFKRYQELHEKNLLVFYCPWIHWFFHLIPLRKMKIVPGSRPESDKIFNFLNRNFHPGRKCILDHIINDDPELLHYGFVTAAAKHYGEHPLMCKDSDFVEFYQNVNLPYENNSTTLHLVDCSVNLKNFFHIAEHVPGIISIQVESARPEQTYFLDLTEKSMIGFVAQRIPIIVGHIPGLISCLRSQGFDLFDDLVDHSYDDELDYERRLILAVELNRRLLSGQKAIPDVSSRLKRNQLFLINEWTDNTLGGLLQQIADFLSKEKTSES